MLNWFNETLSHFPGCFSACILSHLVFRWFDNWNRKRKGKKEHIHQDGCC